MGGREFWARHALLEKILLVVFCFGIWAAPIILAILAPESLR